ncbi:nucleotidyltransferase domain-containing protein [bacterium]|nr:nucleotidyltransferase domain-containing protein [bacterium]
MQQAKIVIFGSRVNGPVKPHSDLDIAVDAGKPLTLKEHSALKDAFEASNLLIRVDVIDLNSITSEFKRLVLETGEKIEF